MPKLGEPNTPLDISSRVEGLRILIIDDDPAKLDALASSLRSMGASVSVGGRGKSGYTQASLKIPDVIISDLISPGEQGWQLVQDIRRHPVLRWTPFLLLNWWEKDDSGHGRVLTDRLLERLEEVLAPHYVIEERRRTNRPLGGHVSSIGPVALLRLLVEGDLQGTLTVNDGWSVFEAKIKKDALHAINRRGVAGLEDEGTAALSQLLLCDSGRWSFRASSGPLPQPNIEPDLESALNQVSTLLADLFNRGFGEKRVKMPLRTRLGILDSDELALPLSAEQIIKLLEKNAVKEEFDALIEELNNPFDLERALRTLVRVGVITPFIKEKDENYEQISQDSVKCALHLFNALPTALSLTDGQTTRENEEGPSGTNEPAVQQHKSAVTETESLSEVKSPSIKSERIHRSTKRPPKPRITEILSTAISTVLSTIMLLVPSKKETGQPIKMRSDAFQMWVAVAITLAFGALVVAGLFVIASDVEDMELQDESQDESSESSEQ